MKENKRDYVRIYAVVYMFVMIYMSFERIVPSELSRWGFVNFCTWQMYIRAKLEGGMYNYIFAFTVIMYALSTYMVVFRKKHRWFLFPMAVAAVDIWCNLLLIAGHFTAIAIFLFKISGIVFMTKTFRGTNNHKGENINGIT